MRAFTYDGSLRDRNRKYEYVIGQVDTSTGEVVWSKRTGSRIRFFRMRAERRMLGFVAIVTFAGLLIANVWNSASSKSTPTLESRAIRRPAAARDTVVIRPARIVQDTPVAPEMETVRVRTNFKSYRAINGTTVIYAENVCETGVALNRAARRNNSARDTALDLNTVSVEELDRILPGVGPVMAKAIVAARPFRSVDDLKKVPRVGPKTFARLAPLVKVE